MLPSHSKIPCKMEAFLGLKDFSGMLLRTVSQEGRSVVVSLAGNVIIQNCPIFYS